MLFGIPCKTHGSSSAEGSDGRGGGSDGGSGGTAWPNSSNLEKMTASAEIEPLSLYTVSVHFIYLP